MVWLCRNTLCLSVLVIASMVGANNVCDSLCRCLDYEAEYFVVNCKGQNDQQPDIDFEMFDWPKSENRTTKAFFNGMSIHLLPKMSGDSNVILLNFDDNLIRTLPSNPFEYFTHLESISIANNFITELALDFLKSPISLKSINLANNSLSSFNPIIVSHLKELTEIDLSRNEFTKLSADFIEAISTVEILRIENNKMYTIDSAYSNIDYKLQQIFLGFNELTLVTGTMFEKFTRLESIDLSNNKIDNIDENAFSSLLSLKLLDLSNNFIKRVYIRLPSTVELLTMANNKLITWPLANIPESLTELELQYNKLEIIFPKDREVDRLRSLDVSHNFIDHLPNTQFFKLDKLDLSYNHLTSVPQNLNTMTPLIRDLVLDGNPIETVYFGEKTMLGSISLSHTPSLKRLESEAFSNLAGNKMSPDGSGACVDIHVSHNEHLSEIDESAFKGVNLCQLDLSYNSLTKIPQNLTVWSEIREGIDLQGNPFSCNCEDQWMLAEILNKLYEKLETQFLLPELKCQSPEWLKGQTFVHFLSHDNPFCSSAVLEKMVQKSGFGGISLDANDGMDIKLELTKGPGFIIIIVMCALILIAMVFIGIRWQRQQNRKLQMRNRLYGYDDY